MRLFRKWFPTPPNPHKISWYSFIISYLMEEIWSVIFQQKNLQIVYEVHFYCSVCKWSQGGQQTWNFWKFGKARKLHEIRKSQGILLARNEYHRSFFKIHSSGEQKLVTPVHISCMLMDFCLREKINLNCEIAFFFFLD